MSFSVKPLLLSTLVLAGGAALHGERPLIDGAGKILLAGSYNNDANPPWVLTVGDGKLRVKDPRGNVTWTVGRTGPLREYDSEDTWLELDRNGTVILWERRRNQINDHYVVNSSTILKSGIKAVLFQNDGTVKYVPR